MLPLQPSDAPIAVFHTYTHTAAKAGLSSLATGWCAACRVRWQNSLRTHTQSQFHAACMHSSHLAASSCLSASPTTAATLASVPNAVLKEVVEGRTGELQDRTGQARVHHKHNTAQPSTA